MPGRLLKTIVKNKGSFANDYTRHISRNGGDRKGRVFDALVLHRHRTQILRRRRFPARAQQACAGLSHHKRRGSDTPGLFHRVHLQRDENQTSQGELK